MPTVAPKRSRLARLTSGLVAVALVGGMTLAAAAPASAAPVADASNNAPAGGAFASDGRELAQTFTAINTGDMRTVTFATSGIGPGAGTLSLATTANGVPTATVIATAQLTTRSSGILTFDFTGDAPVTAGTTYALLIAPSSRILAGSAYAGGMLFSRTVGTTTYSNLAFDLRFATTVEPTVVDAPLSLTSAAGNRSVALAWSAPTTNSAPTSYRIEYRVAGTNTWSTAPAVSTTSTTVSGLTGGTTWEFAVSAVKQNVTSPRVITSAVPYALPSAPLDVVISPLDGSVSVSWRPPVGPGTSPIRGYSVDLTSSAGTVSRTGTSPMVFADLVNGRQYTATVVALNDSGYGAPSAAVSAAPSAYALAPELTATGTDSALDLSWTVPTSDGSDIIGYQVEVDGVVRPGTITGTSTRVAGLVNGDSYDVRVRAVNSRGGGAWSEQLTRSPYRLATAPRAVEAVIGDGSVDLSWDAPLDDGGRDLVSYTVTASSTGFANRTFTGITATDFTVTGLTNGRAYSFRIVALTSAGVGPASTAVLATPSARALAPVLTVTEVDSALDLSWTVPVSDGSAVTAYEVEVDGVIRDGVVTATSTRIADLENGVLYDVRVRAINARGVGTWSSLNTGSPFAPISAPLDVVAEIDDESIDLSWDAPLDDGGRDLVSYTVTASSDGSTDVIFENVTATEFTATGLENGREYSITIAAVTSAGAGASSTAVTATPSARALAPDLTVTEADSALDLSWTTPTSDGSAITGYEIELDGVVLGDVVDANGFRLDAVNGTAYDVRVRALNSRGAGAWSELLTRSPLTTATAPVLAASASGDAFASVDWDAPVDDGGRPVDSYTVTVSSPGIADVVVDGLTATEYTATGLENGRAYTFTVVAVTAAGAGAALVSESLVPLALPGAPVITERIEGDELVGVRWSVPESDGSAITGYQVSYGTSDTTLVVVGTTDTEFTVPEANNGLIYEFRVRAINAAGTGPWSEPEVARARTVSDAPRQLEVEPSARSVHLIWEAPDFAGGAPIDDYTIEFREAGAEPWRTAWASAAATDAYIYGVGNGTAYEFRIAATTVAGIGAFSEIVTATPFDATFVFTTPEGISLDGARLVAGTDIVLTGVDLPVGAKISLEFHSDPVVIGTAVVGADGSSRITASIPADATEGAHELVGSVTSQGQTVSSAVGIQVVAPLVVVPSPDGELVVTGTDLGLGLGLAGLLAGAGIALTLIARRRSALTIT